MVIREAAVDVGIEEMVLAGQTRDQLLDHRARRAVAGVPADAERPATEILTKAIAIKTHDIGIANGPPAVFPVPRGPHGPHFLDSFAEEGAADHHHLEAFMLGGILIRKSL